MTQGTKPNVVVILADDMGFADLGVMGSEIRTPTLDGLARDGVLMTQMYNCARCCPTRASLLTGLYPHQAGIGHMGADLGTPAYQGFLREDAATLAEHLRAGGYRTLMSGKWHVGGDFMARHVDAWEVGSPRNPTPRQRGFDRFYGIVDGVTHFFSPHYVLDDDTRVTDFDDDYYFTDAITDKAIGMVEDAVEDETPFFLYLAHTAPHWPLHAPPDDIARYDGVYAKGWDATRTARHEEMNGRGVLQTAWEISPRDGEVCPWEDTPHPDWEAAKMATYAAMMDRMDQSIGRFVAALKRLGQFENTLILFLSDNGGCAEFMAEDGWAKFFPDRTHDGRQIEMGNRPDVRPGDALTYQSYDKPWANVSNAPFRLFKHYVHEGGVSTPLIAHWPNGFGPGGTAHAPAHVADIVPTILDATGVAAATEARDQAVQPLEGFSFLPLLKGADWSREAPIYFEHEGNCAIRAGQFKLVRQYGMDWELYDMEADRTELHDLAGRMQDREAALLRDYQGWAARAGVMDWDVALPRLQAAWEMENVEG
ncbi:MAG: arylsulfatase [Rhodobacteraceae bacterium]|nr:arylsulfatase [Paracoccaceae bacterium]